MKLRKFILILVMCLSLSIPTFASTINVKESSNPEPRGWYSFNVTVGPSGNKLISQNSFVTTNDAVVECDKFVGSSGNKVYFTFTDSNKNAITNTAWVSGPDNVTLTYKRSAPSLVTGGYLRVQGSYSNNGNTTVSGHSCPD